MPTLEYSSILKALGVDIMGIGGEAALIVQDQQRAEHAVEQYLEIQREIGELEQRKKLLRDQLHDELNVSDADLNTVWDYGAGKVELCKGRKTTKLDRVALVLAGVTAEVLDKATTVSTAKPSLRITAVKNE